MFRCDSCHQTTQPNIQMTRVIIETRRKEYLDRDGNIEGVGREIVKEIAIGPCCKDS